MDDQPLTELLDQVKGLYEVYSFKHAESILISDFEDEFRELLVALLKFRFTREHIIKPGGNESEIPKIFSKLLRDKGWEEKNLGAELTVFEKKGKDRIEKGKLDHGSHKVDYLKGRVAFDLEWNSKDQTFDRDLYAFRAFFEYNAISVGVLVTRSLSLDDLFRHLDQEYQFPKGKRLMDKYGKSTTHWGKLSPRLEANRNGGCPVLVFCITPSLLEE